MTAGGRGGGGGAGAGRAGGGGRGGGGRGGGPARPGRGGPGAGRGGGARRGQRREGPTPDPVTGRPAHGGRDRHLALAVADLDALRASKEAAGVAYTQSKSGRRALFCRDLDGNALEFVQQD